MILKYYKEAKSLKNGFIQGWGIHTNGVRQVMHVNEAGQL